MKPLLLFIRGLLLSGLLLAGGRAAEAQVQGGQLTYTYLSTAANGDQTYRVQAQYLFACSLNPPPASLPLTAAMSCNGLSRFATLNPVGAPVVDMPYCPSVQAQVNCLNPMSGPAYLNYAMQQYEGTIALPPAPEWLLSVVIFGRPTVANVSTGSNVYLEARLRSLLTLPNGSGSIVINSSPTFATTGALVSFVAERQRTTLGFAATDADRINGQPDSLVYSLDRPLSGCGTYGTSAAYPAAGCQSRIDPLCAFRFFSCTLPTLYSAALPIAVLADTTYENGSRTRPLCPPVPSSATVQPRFSLDARQGSFTFTPADARPGSAALGLNKYLVSGKVTEYRKIAGRYYEVGSVRRELVVVVVPAVNNPLPMLAGATANAGSNATLRLTRDTTEVSVVTGSYSRIRLFFADPSNSGPLAVSPRQLLTVTAPADLATSTLQGGDLGTFAVVGNGTPTPVATFELQAGAAAAGTTLLIPLRVQDNACPYRGVLLRVVRLQFISLPQLPRIVVAGQSTVPVRQASICPGGTLRLLAEVGRPDSLRNAATGQVVAQQYSYQWGSTNANAATNGLPALRTTPDLSVSPTVDTRYTLRMSPVLGFAPGQFTDTTSIVVRVAALSASITRSGNVLRSSISTGNQWLRNGQPIAGATAQTYAPTTAGTYAVQVTYTTGPVTCVAPPSQPVAFAPLGSRTALAGTSLRVAPNPTADGRLRVELGGYKQAVGLSVYDLLGRAVLQQQVAAPNPAGEVRELDLSQQPAGLYLLQVHTQGGLDVRRVVRQ